MLNLSVFNNLPEVSILKDQGITLEGIQAEMVADFEKKKTALSGEECRLVATDDRRLIIDAIGGELWLICQYMDIAFKQNFLRYMYGPYLKNWAANIGFFGTGEEAATCTLEFTLSEVQEEDTIIPAGTRATAGDGVFFATDEDITIAAGEISAAGKATCTNTGTVGNDYVIGKISAIADPVPFVESVSNTTKTAGGHDEYTTEELREVILNWPSTYSVAGPSGAYETMAKAFSSRIVDARCITTQDALVQIYIMLNDSEFPTEEYCAAVEEFIISQKRNPGTDRITVIAPGATEYTIEGTYYISRDNEDVENIIKDTIISAAEEFAVNTASKIGGAITPSDLISNITAAGAKTVEITSPTYTQIPPSSVGICTAINLTYGGLLDE